MKGSADGGWDAELVRRGLVPSRDRAVDAVASGRVTVNGAVAQKAARLVLPGDALELSGPADRYVSRGGEKLEGALAAFHLDVAGMRCCDVGASTGGFTDCLLQSGAAAVVAVDVGRAQMHERLAADPRVILYERTDVRNVDPAGIGAPFDLVTADVSFISLATVMACLAGLAAPGAPVVVSGQAPVRGGTTGGQPRPGRHPRPRAMAGRARPSDASGGHRWGLPPSRRPLAAEGRAGKCGVLPASRTRQCPIIGGFCPHGLPGGSPKLSPKTNSLTPWLQSPYSFTPIGLKHSAWRPI